MSARHRRGPSAKVMACVVGATLSLAAGGAGAQTAAPTEEEIAARRVALEEAQRAEAAGDHARALDLAERAGRIQMTPSVRRFIAHEQNALHQYARALGTSELCVRETEARGAGTMRDYEAVLTACRAEAQTAREHTGRLSLRFPGAPPPGTEVRLDGQPISSAMVGLPVPVSAGTVRIEVRARGFNAFTAQAEVRAGATAEVPVALTPGGDMGPVDEPPDNGPGVTPAGPTPGTPPRRRRERPAQGGVPVGPIVLGSVAGVALIAGSVALGVYVSASGELNSALRNPPADDPSRTCAQEGDQIVCGSGLAATLARGRNAGHASLGLLFGAAAVGAGAVIWGVMSRPRRPASEEESGEDSARRIQVSPWVNAAGAGLSIGGAL